MLDCGGGAPCVVPSFQLSFHHCATPGVLGKSLSLLITPFGEAYHKASQPFSDSKVKIFASQTNENVSGDVDEKKSSERLAERHQEKVSFPML